MGKWNSKEIAERARKDFEKTWLETKALIPEKTEAKYPAAAGRPHVLFQTVQRLREAYLGLGFEEVVNPIFIEDKEIRRQFGSEAAAVLDRCYYLGGLPRPDVGLSDEKIKEIEKLGVSVKKESLRELLHRYKKGEFGGDDLIYKIADSLNVDDILATKIINEVFPEFRALEPESSRLTLRSHMTSGWFLTLERLMGRKPFPIKLFSVDRCFRREQAEDATHLRTHHSASCVVVDEEVSVEDGKAVAKALLSSFGFEKFKFKLDEKRSKYYAPDTQTEVYGYSANSGWVELATFGIYSPVALSRYKIEFPAMNLGLGVERLAMVLHGYKDVREMVYPKFYAEWRMSDEEIASLLRIDKTPASKEGHKIAEKIIEAAKKYGGEKSPCEFLVYSGKIRNAKVKVKLVEREEGKKLLGPAAFNEIYVFEGSIYGDIRAKGASAVGKLKYIDGIANLAAHEIEKGIAAGKEKITVRVPIVRSLGDINLKLNEVALRYITTYSKSIDVRGPVFITVEAEIS
ncbi:MAG: O-phosphoserine--tRNA ligase [Euryarchaeota archaeon]|nr:O-phosphoserine--tRNA ligase [Euryarchaeota archaeon]